MKKCNSLFCESITNERTEVMLMTDTLNHAFMKFIRKVFYLTFIESLQEALQYRI